MKITISSIALLLLFALASSAQNSYSIKGSVVDTAAKVKLTNATVMVLNAKDSILRKFTRSAAEGEFAINNLAKGKYILVLSYPDYADYSEAFTLDSVKKDHNFGKVSMILKSRLLHDVIIKGQATAIKIKGDTTEFNAKAYVIQPNDRVEDLIKQFPGIQVDKDGKITAQGQTVSKVLVDGEEFFGDDPTLVTKNIRADMVDKVQLYDKKSDQATFTGIDDGVKTKTLNIKLKEDKKNGYFGKVDAGVGTDGYYQGQGMYNRFTSKQKFSAYTTDGNTGKTGLGWQDSQKYGDGGGVQVDDNGGISLNFNGNDDGLDSFDGRYNGQGIPEAKTGGLHYDGKWNKDNQSLNANYKIGSLDVNGTKNSITQNNLPTGAQYTTSDQTFNNSIFRQKLDLTYLVKLDTSSTLKLSIDGTSKHSKSDNEFLNIIRRGEDTLLNRSARKVTGDVNEHIFNASAFYTKKFKKKGRTLSALFSESIDNSDGKGYLNSQINFYNNLGVQDSTQLVNQYKTSVTKDAIFNSNITYTEPLSKYLSLIVNYGVNINNGSLDRRSYNQSAPGVYNVLDPTVSNYFKLNQFANQAGAVINYRKGKTILNLGTKASDVSFEQIDEYTGDVFKRNFINWNPQAMYQYKFSQQQTFYMFYNGNTTQPTINQIQPVKVNTDPTNIYLGNPDLTPAFTNRFNVAFYSFKVLSGQYINFGSTFSFTSNQIVNNTSTGATGISTIQYTNLNGKTPTSFNLYGSFGRKISPIDLSIGLNVSANAYTNYNYANNALAASNSGVYSVGLNINKYVQKKYDFSFNFGPTYRVSKSALQQLNNNSTDLAASGRFDVYLPGKFQIASDINYNYTGKTETFDQDLTKTLWNATLSKTFFKDNTLKFSLSGNDLLNQNIGFSRGTNGNIISQNSYTTIKRYFMLSVSWDFNKMGGAAVKK